MTTSEKKPLSKITSLFFSLFICSTAYFGLQLQPSVEVFASLTPICLFFYLGCRGKFDNM